MTMWVFLNSGPVSVVAHRNKPDILLVRARRKAHLEAALAGVHAQILELDGADYRFRAEVSREEWGSRLAQLAEEMDYDNFKSSIRDAEVHDCAFRVFDVIRRDFPDR